MRVVNCLWPNKFMHYSDDTLVKHATYGESPWPAISVG